MKARNVIFFVLLVVGILSAYLFYAPVPDGITEPVKYRTLIAFESLIKLTIKLTHFAHRDEPYQSYYMRSIRYVESRLAPTPQAEVEGSNIRSRVTEFNGVTVRLYEPISKKGVNPQPAIVYIHGGGLCVGSADSYDSIVRKVAETLDMVVVSINYRLAPEHLAPFGFEDCLAATQYFMQHAQDFGVDKHRIGVVGDSAGGGLSASVAQAIHDDHSLPELKLQVLIYPWTQSIDLNTPSYQKYTSIFGEGGIIPRWSMATYVSLSALGKVDPVALSQIMANNHTSSKFKKTSIEYSYVDPKLLPEEFRYTTDRGTPRGSAAETGDDKLWARLSSYLLDWRIAPLMRQDLSGLPPAYVVTVEFDAIRDDGIFYQARLKNAGVPVTWVNYEGGFHGLLSVGKGIFQLADTMFDKFVEYIRNNI